MNVGFVSAVHAGSGERPPSLSKLPPLTALRAFVVTARHLSFTAAASELHVTPAAVGQQVRQLEACFGRPLFERKRHRLSLTPAGEAILPALADAFEQMLGAVAILLDSDGDSLSISVAPSFASKWLVPRLDRFRARHPDLEIRVDASTAPADFATGEIDCAIRYGSGVDHDLVVKKLLAETVFPVASPALLTGTHPPRRPEDLKHCVLLHDDSPEDDASCPDWTTWLRAAGVNISPAGIRFNQSALVLEAAVAGHGVALAKGRLADGDLRSGRLVRPFGEAQKIELFYCFVAPRHKLRLPRVQAFRDWLAEEAAEIDRLRGNGEDQRPRLSAVAAG
jgi:LysR family transcriptional regulator, glycine cleavage system transcriptional activator